MKARERGEKRGVAVPRAAHTGAGAGNVSNFPVGFRAVGAVKEEETEGAAQLYSPCRAREEEEDKKIDDVRGLLQLEGGGWGFVIVHRQKEILG